MLANTIMILQHIAYQINMLYTLNLHNAIVNYISVKWKKIKKDVLEFHLLYIIFL